MSKVTSKRYKTIYNPSRPYTDFRLSKQLALSIRQLGNSGDSAEELLFKMYKVIAGDPTLRKKVREMPKHEINGDFIR